MATIKTINNVSKFTKCCGCGCCESICPVHAITMVQDERGFFRPQINKTKCINCGVCANYCNFNYAENEVAEPLRYYAFKASDNIRKNSQSGGAFFALAELFLINHPNESSIYGAKLVDNRYIKHIRVTTTNELSLLQKSKYAKSDIRGTFYDVYNDLMNGKYVMYSGTPCQIAAIKSFLQYKKISLEKLLLVDIICHGTPPSRFWSEYVDLIEKKNSSKVVDAKFRDKTFGWASHFETFLLENGNIIKSTKYRDLFYSYHSLDDACFTCKYASYNRFSDITLGDMWGNQENLKDFKDKNGVSLIIVNSIKGEEIVDILLTNGEYRVVEKKETKQPNLLHPSSMPKDYYKFWNYYQKNGFEKTIRKYIDHNYKKKINDLYKRVQNKLKRIFS